MQICLLNFISGSQPRLLQRDLHTHVHFSTIYNSQAMEIAKMPHYQQMD
jgi:hypothetical protein